MHTVEERKEITHRYRILLREWKNRRSKEEALMVRKAFDFAVKAHDGMRRRTKEPYIYHPLEVATICAKDMHLDGTAIVCALMHDIVEDTGTTIEEIQEMFNPRVAMIIDGLTKIKGMLDDGKRSIQAEYFKHMIIALAEDMRVILIKLADRLHNMRTLDAMPRDKQLKIASETLTLIAPLAYRIGLYNIKTELEDLSLKYTEPEVYHHLQAQLEESRTDRDRLINRFIYPIKNLLSKHDISYMIHVRMKSIYSIWQKMQKQNIPFEDVYDIFAIRIVLDSPPETERLDCWKVYSLITEIYKPRHDRIRDWISIPKANGYEALHTTVMSHLGKWVEIQIRSQRMHELAETGYASHHFYKNKNSDENNVVEHWLTKIKEQFQNPEHDALDFLDDFKLDLYSEEIYTFTPKGDMVKLPVGATALDFAFNIHTEIGNHSLGAKVNLALVPLKHVLKSGDQVEIITSKKQRPQSEWLDFVVTARAKNYIKEALKEEKKKYYSIGLRKLRKLFEELEIEPGKQNIRQLQEFLGKNSLIDLYYDVAKEKVGLKELKACCQKTQRSQWYNALNPFSRSRQETKPDEEDISLIIRNKPEEVLLSDSTDLKYKIATCCNPIPGDDIIGLINPKKPMMIHRVSCKNAQETMARFGNRIVKAKWNEKETILFLAGIEFKSIDKIGFIYQISDIISNRHKLKIRSFNLQSSAEVSEGIIMLYVNDTKQLNDLISDLKKIKAIKKISRLNPS
ncbi:MAG: RelA/SpoT family protein [Bacteroidales bacterium]|nr:RelA/SpoT family protein [Bacteroidales bacterium]